MRGNKDVVRVNPMLARLRERAEDPAGYKEIARTGLEIAKESRDLLKEIRDLLLALTEEQPQKPEEPDP